MTSGFIQNLVESIRLILSRERILSISLKDDCSYIVEDRMGYNTSCESTSVIQNSGDGGFSMKMDSGSEGMKLLLKRWI